MAARAAKEPQPFTRFPTPAMGQNRGPVCHPVDDNRVRASYPDDLRDEIERYLEALRFSTAADTAGLEEAMRYSLLAGGKRIRPVLALATARALGMDPA